MTKGNQAYYRKRLRMAAYEAATVTPVTVVYRGKSVSAQQVDLSPYRDDPARSRFEKFSRKTYRFLLSEAVPGIKVLNLPFLFTDSAHMFRHLDGKLGARYAANLQAAGFVVLGWYDGGSRSFYCNRPVTGFRDLAGARIRVQQSEIYTEMVKLLDAKPVTLPYKEVLDALQQGKVDCAENNMPSYEATGHYKVAKNVYVTNHVISPEALVVSTQLWGKLSKEDQAAFAQAGAKSALLMRELWSKRVALAQDITAKQGVVFTKSHDSASLIRRMAPLYGRYTADPTTREELLTIIAK
ncbi:MAG: TRAP transporter substrate-binding protein DctP [Polaromonas sp.]|nr:TRAP transporter substrate-binding protein DctP [Polaromonas sp.]